MTDRQISTFHYTLNRAADAVDVVAAPAVKVGYVIAGLAVMALSVNVFADVMSRNLFNIPFEGTNELVSGWWMVALVFLAIATAQRRKEHVQVVILTGALPPSMLRFAERLAWLLMAVFIGFVGWFGFTYALREMSVGEHGVVSGLPIWPFRFVVPLSAVIAILQLSVDILRPAVDMPHAEDLAQQGDFIE